MAAEPVLIYELNAAATGILNMVNMNSAGMVRAALRKRFMVVSICLICISLQFAFITYDYTIDRRHPQ